MLEVPSQHPLHRGILQIIDHPIYRLTKRGLRLIDVMNVIADAAKPRQFET
jgi:hypothetical protein